MTAISKGWMSKPTARSDTARLVSKMYAAECKGDVFQIVSRITEFPNSAVKEKNALTTLIDILKAIAWSKLLSASKRESALFSVLLKGREQLTSMVGLTGVFIQCASYREAGYCRFRCFCLIKSKNLHWICIINQFSLKLINFLIISAQTMILIEWKYLTGFCLFKHLSFFALFL